MMMLLIGFWLGGWFFAVVDALIEDGGIHVATWLDLVGTMVMGLFWPVILLGCLYTKLRHR